MLMVLLAGPLPANVASELALRTTARAKDYARALTPAASEIFAQGQGRKRGMPSLPSNMPGVKAGHPASKQERQNRLQKIEISPAGDVSIELGEQVVLAGVPLDQENNTIHGLRAEWESSDARTVSVSPAGEIVGKRIGNAVITATIGNKKAKAKVTVGPRKAHPGFIMNGSELVPQANLLAKQKSGDASRRKSQRRSLNAHNIGRTLTPMPEPGDQIPSLFYPTNAVGAPPGKTTPGAGTPGAAGGSTETPGSANFTFGVPLVSLPGRGLDLNLGMVYNSRLWNKSTTTNNKVQGTYNINADWPAPGFRIGFGRWQNVSAGEEGPIVSGVLIDADGTRHQMKDTSSNPSQPNCIYNSVDGTYIQATASGGCGGQVTVYYPNGTQTLFGYAGSPTRITDRNGNYILISYVSGTGLISTIQDTLGRYVTFHYSNYELVSITAPGFNGGADRQVARFYYQDYNPQQSGLYPTPAQGVVISGAPSRVITDIYFPSSVESGDAHLGYHYDYSAYGMIYQIRQCRGMTVSTIDPVTAGTVTSLGTVAATTTYDYPIYPSILTDVPKFHNRTDDWAGRTSAVPVWQFSVNETTGVSTVTAPDGTVAETHANVHHGFWDDGLITDNILKFGGAELSHTVMYWDPTSDNQPQLRAVKTTNDAGETRGTYFDYGDYNNVTSASERDITYDTTISTTELRRTETIYETSSAYTARGLLHLPKTVKVLAPGSITPSAQTDYYYDESSLASNTGLDDDMMYADPGTTSRGNLTRIRTYPNTSNLSTYIDHTTSFDTAGNAVTAQVDCCQQKSIAYSADYFYAYPTSVTSGNGPTRTTTSTYDFNTGLTATTRDVENNVTTSFYYNSDSLRPEHIAYPNGGIVQFGYNDNLLLDAENQAHSFTLMSTKLDTSGGGRWIDSYSYFDGRGAVTKTFEDAGGNGWSTQDIQYDVMSRPVQSSHPYYSAGYDTATTNPTGLWTVQTFDRLGRVTRVDMPSGDASNPTSTYTTTEFHGIFTTVTDQAGKQRRQKTDGLGRVIRLDEPDDSGSIGDESSPTRYATFEYDLLGNLLHTTQGSQQRFFKYDSLSRLTFERQVEQDAPWTTSDYVANNNQWSRKFIYNSNGNVVDTYDARQVNTHVVYDGLNRVTDITYSDGTPAAHYYYDSNTPSSPPSFDHGYAAGRLTAMTYGSSTATTGNYFGYDEMGQVKVQVQRTGSNNYVMSYGYNLAGMLTSQSYPTGRTLTYDYDDAGRLQSLSDANKTYANQFSYEPHGGLKAETFGNGMIHSVAYNRALQPSEIKLQQTTNGPELQRFNYSYGTVNQSSGVVDTTKNNGQIGRLDGYINGAKQWDQRYVYDSMSRLSIAAEYQQGDNNTRTWQTQYDYDRFGNRMQYQGNYNVAFTQVQASDFNADRNRFVETGSTATTYDAAGNITTDRKFRDLNYSYDANGRMLAAEHTDHTNHQDSVYDCGGQRVQTTLDGATRLVVYDLFGENIVEYMNGVLERENIYRGGQLLAISEPGTSAPTAAPTELAAATYDPNAGIKLAWSANGANNFRIERRDPGNGYHYVGVSGTTNFTDTTAPSGSAYLYKVCAADQNGNCTSHFSNVTLATAYSFEDDPIVTTAQNPASATPVRAQHILQLRAAINALRSLAVIGDANWTGPTPAPGGTIYATDVTQMRDRLNEALVALGIDNGSYSEALAGAPNGTLIRGIHITELRQRILGGKRTCKSIGQFVDDFYQGFLGHAPTTTERNAAIATLSQAQANGDSQLTAAAHNMGLNLFSTAYPSSNNNHQFVIDAYEGYLQRAPDSPGLNYWEGLLNQGYSRTTMLDAFAGSGEFQDKSTSLCIEGSGGTSTPGGVRYVMSDVQGSTRVVMNSNGSGTSIIVARHDYLPFGEEIGSGMGLRNESQGYGVTDTNRWKYAMTQRDPNGLDHTAWRKYDSFAGRWTSPDPIEGGNAYAYANNDPVNSIDPSGLFPNMSGAEYGWKDVMNGFWGWGDLNNRPHGHPTDPDADPCPPGHLCVDQRLRQYEGEASWWWVYAHDFGVIDPFGPQGTRPRRATNPNCLKYAVNGSPGVGDPFKTNINDPSMAGHIGAHALSPVGKPAEAVTLAPLAGKIIKTNAQDSHLFYMDVRLANGNVAVYFDLQSIRQKSGSLKAGDVIGTVRPGNIANKVGLHVTIVLGQYYNDFNAHRSQYTQNGPTKYFIDPLGKDSPINCPGEKLIE